MATIRYGHGVTGRTCTPEDFCEECRAAGRFAITKGISASARAEADVSRFLASLSSGKSATLAKFRERVMTVVAARVAARIAARGMVADEPRGIVPSAYANWYCRP